MKVVVAQKGAREHFLAARALHRHGLLAQLVTDWYAPKHPLLRWAMSASRLRWCQAALAARAPEIPDSLVRPNRLRGLIGKWTQSVATFGRSPYERALQADMAFIRALASLSRPPHDVFFGYSYMSLEMLEIERTSGVFTVLDQIDPGPLHFHVVAEEMKRHPELAGAPPAFPELYFARLRREWKLADVIVVNSEWSREAIVAEGADPAKVEVLPLAYEPDAQAEVSGGSAQLSSVRSQVSPLHPLRLLWLGQINAGKGIHYLMEAARLLEREPIHFDLVGTVGISAQALASAPPNMRFHGHVSRDRVPDWYRRADVFVLPTLSDGFALTQLEAMAHGVPVIATPNCGRVVEHGQTGFLVPAGDAKALAEAIERFVRQPGLAGEMASRCCEASAAFSIEAYAQRLVGIIEKHLRKGS